MCAVSIGGAATCYGKLLNRAFGFCEMKTLGKDVWFIHLESGDWRLEIGE